MAQVSIPDAVRAAAVHHQAGRLADAEAMYRHVLLTDPVYPDALHLLGVLLAQRKQFEQGIGLIRQAISLQPESATFHINLANACKEANRFDEAIAAYREGLRLAPGNAEALKYLGAALREREILAPAEAALRQSIAIKPDDPFAWGELAMTLSDADEPDRAIEAYRHALTLKPDYVEVYNNLGLALTQKKEFAAGREHYRKALSLRPNYLNAKVNLANNLCRSGDMAEAAEIYRQLQRDEPTQWKARVNAGRGLAALGLINESIEALLAARALQPDSAETHFDLSYVLLLSGRFEEGWLEYEWRWKWQKFPSPPRNFDQPLWDGSPLNGRTLLLHVEQGFGDTLQFIRYLPMVLSRKGQGGKVALLCETETFRLLRNLPGLDWIIQAYPLPAFDVHCPLMSLPGVFHTTAGAIPHDVPYLKADPKLAATWRRWLDERANPRDLRVGLCWAGRPGHTNDANRTMALAQLAPLSQVAGVTFVSCQKGKAAAEAKQPPAGLNLLDASALLNDFADTAALVDQLDLVISVDTSLVHLAGALAKPTWVLLPFRPDWRWRMKTEQSDWYPSIRLFRQSRPEDWEKPIEQVAQSLKISVDRSQPRC